MLCVALPGKGWNTHLIYDIVPGEKLKYCINGVERIDHRTCTTGLYNSISIDINVFTPLELKDIIKADNHFLRYNLFYIKRFLEDIT
jgi:hypothetical protein